MKYRLSPIKSFNKNKDEEDTIKIISKEIKMKKPPHYGGLGILICTGHIGESTFGGLIILDNWKSYVSMKGWTKNIYPMMMMDWVVHEELHKTQNQKGMKKIYEYVSKGKLRSNFSDLKKYSPEKTELYHNVTDHYYVCLFTHLWMVKHYGDEYLSIIDKIWTPYNIFEKYVREHSNTLLKLMLKLKIFPPDLKNYVTNDTMKIES
jgi:hypothetical protein